MTTDIIEVKKAEMLGAINRAEVDIQVATAKSYPRDIKAALNQIVTYAAMDKDTADECFYVLRRGGSVIEGLSVRMAEIIAGAWGNLRVQTRIIGNDGKWITAQAVCFDLETNVAVCKEVQRRITDKQGRTFSDDMQVVTGNAAASIALRNAVLTVVPKAVTKRAVDEVRRVALGQSIDIETGRANCIKKFARIGVSEDMLLWYLGIESVDDIDKQRLLELRGTMNAIEEGTTTVDETFIQPMKQAQLEAEAKKKAATAKDKARKAIAVATGKVEAAKPESVDPETGELFKEGGKQ